MHTTSVNLIQRLQAGQESEAWERVPSQLFALLNEFLDDAVCCHWTLFANRNLECDFLKILFSGSGSPGKEH